jgi:phosphatidylinositol-3-phosphatase
VYRRLAALTAVAGLCAAAALPASAGRARTFGAPASPRLGVHHVFVIVLENESYSASYETNPNRYLRSVLPGRGALLTQYFGIGHESNPNYLAMVSGQAPNPMTQSDCQDYVDFQPAPAVFDPRGNGQAVGIGCVYPDNVLTLSDQLQRAHLSWHGYMEDMGNDVKREPAHCGEPAFSAGTGMRDGTQSAEKQDQYAARHNPFVYFHSLIDSGSCHHNVVPLYRLGTDLKRAATTPNFSFITPNLCNDGHDTGCANGQPGGLVSIDRFLRTWVPRITSSPAFKKDGLLIVTTDEAAASDAGSCCGEQPGPDSPLPGVEGMGGGRTGTVVIGRCVPAGRKVATAYNHYSLLRSLEDLFGIKTGGSDGKGHLGYAGASGLAAFGPDVFSACPAPARKG